MLDPSVSVVICCFPEVNFNVSFRNASDANEQHDAEIDSARVAAEQDGLKNTDDTLHYIHSEFLHFFSSRE